MRIPKGSPFMTSFIQQPDRSSRSEIAAIVFALSFPTLLTWIYFILLADHAPALQQSAYSIGKLIQFGFPIVWVWLIRREQVRQPRLRPDGLLVGTLIGVAITSGSLAAYWLVLKPMGAFDSAGEMIRQRVAAAGIDSPMKFAALGLFYSIGHSLLEEYYWRWFVFARLRSLTSLPKAIVISSLGFMAHHVVVLSHYFGGLSYLSCFFSLGVAVGGVIWAWLYARSRSIFGPWLSHALVDAGIFLVGYEIVRSAL